MALPEELPTLPPVFRLVHTDFNEGNLLISSPEDAYNCGVLDWEGARCPLETREPVSPSRKEQLQQLYDGIVTDGRKLGPESPLCLQRLLELLECWPSYRLYRQRLDTLFLDWFADAESQAKKKSVCHGSWKPFARLRHSLRTLRQRICLRQGETKIEDGK
ncbi:hypothetical protein B0H15DRAFT_822769 [Mycena belliarum]|uniref:Aminoglycoside phosphotransferase domain-containing protein n=1 Tax=Mycena belliarum TaxID=1033014 RepID=A0AAD6XT33_9AGAR|nr:hypothetical protein B0H15DRAFT_822769 [Mycena belliae]